MNAIIKLENGYTAETDNIKCPICGKKMEIDNYQSELPKEEFFTEEMTWPRSGYMVKKETTYKTLFRCPNRCGDFTVEHKIKTLLK